MTYREQYIYELKQDNQSLYGELQELPYGSLAYKRVRREIEVNNTEISVMQDIIKRVKERNEQVRINSESISSLI